MSLRSPDEAFETDGLPPAPGTTRSPLARGRQPSRPRGENLPLWHEPTSLEPEPAPESFVYVPVLRSAGPRWSARIRGLVGLIALVAAAALVLAIGAYQLGQVLSQVLQRFMG
jgi:hypothetical protein